MNDTTTFKHTMLLVSGAESPETLFAKVLERFQLSGNDGSALEVVEEFLAISASIAKDKQRSFGDSDSQEFESWDLETKLWHLVYILFSYRLSSSPPGVNPPLYASYAFKREDFLNQNPKIKELLLILQWLQQNSNDVIPPSESEIELKWNSTKVAIENQALAALTSRKLENLVDSIDVDAPLRSDGEIAKQDAFKDEVNFGIIYELLLNGENEKAASFAAETGNYTLSMILLGASQDYIDPVIDDFAGARMMDVDEDESVVVTTPSGIKHKYLWYQTVYRLAKDPKIGTNEALIYSYLCGADLTENIKHSSSWEGHMNLYVNQLLTHHLRTFLQKDLIEHQETEEMLSTINFPVPQHQSVDGILNTLQNTSAISGASKNPFRVIMGSVIIDQLILFLHNSFKSADSNIVEDKHVLRVLAHLAVVSVALGLDQGSKAPTKIITKYISRLSESGLDDLVPVYLSFIPDEKDVRECYSIFLTTITDSEKRSRQLDILRNLGISAFNDAGTPVSSTTEDLDDQYESKIHNVLKRTVERVMLETQAHYQPLQDIQLKADEIDDVDIKLSRSVEWFYENYMYEDAIIATRTIFQRFLLTGRLRAIKEFVAGKNFKLLLKSYDSSVQIRSMGADTPSLILEVDKEELLQYDKFGQCLNYLDEWKTFVGSKSQTYWQSTDVENSILKITLHLRAFILTWLQDAIQDCEDAARVQLYRELRSLYVPYVVIELLQVLQECRLHDWKYMHQAFSLINEVANDKENDYLRCFISCGRVGEFVSLAGDVAMVAMERGTSGIFI